MINRKITKGKKAPQTVSNFVISFFSSFFCVDVRISLIFRHSDDRATDFGILWTQVSVPKVVKSIPVWEGTSKKSD